MKSQYLLSLSASTAIAIGTILMGGESATASKPVFYCQSNEGMPKTVAKSNNGVDRAIFHWNLDRESTSANSQELCDSVTQKLNNYMAEGNDLSSLTFKASTVYGEDLDSPDFPVVCVAGESDPCKLPLFTLNPSDDPRVTANNALNSILDPALQATPAKSNDRGVQSTSYQVNFWQLLGFD
ncbi:hypothetical protein I4641_03435 [Waterburya agarophytonicola K14]|uniref:Uncharacterized protein n=1 Tax=Waterburya agarophytonicola KI4 TaxID=2874699 RepID=A0A964BNS3_9CYAN|nr:COP23 domain-containing protein [Waterburya agarophytonicola]MCC0176031.1 hypothetical protein [Waterburya agarophytonicola KI4]